MTFWRAKGALNAGLLVIAAVALAAIAVALSAAGAEGATVSQDTTYKDENLVFTEDIDVIGGARLTFKGCDVTFRPTGTSPVVLRVKHGSLGVHDTDLKGEGAGFIISSHGPTDLRNVTATGLGAFANSSLTSLGLPMSAHGGFMFYGTEVDIYNLDISGAPATALYAEDCEIDIFSLGARDACAAYTGTDKCAAVAFVFSGDPPGVNSHRRVELNSSKIQTSANHGLLVAVSGTGYDVEVDLLATEVSTCAGSGLLVYEVGNHAGLRVGGDTNEVHHAKGDAILWVRKGSRGDATMDLEMSRLYSNVGSGLRVSSTSSQGSADLTLDGCVVEDTSGYGALVAASGCTQSLNVTLEDCTLDHPSNTGFQFTTTGDDKTSSYHMRLLGTRVEGAGGHGFYGKLSQCYATFNLTVDGSQIVGSRSDGVHVEHSLQYFTYLTAPAVTSNVTIRDSRISDSGGYGVYDLRYLKSYYYWAQEKPTLHAALNVLGTTIANHTKSAVVVTQSASFQYCVYTTDLYVGGSQFINNSGHGVYMKVDALTQTNGGSTNLGVWVWDSGFEDLRNTGVYLELRRADDALLPFHVRGCDFEALDDHGVVLTAPSTPYAGNLDASVEDCTFTDLGDRAVHVSPGRPQSTADDHSLALRGLRVHNTTGILASIDGYASEVTYALAIEGLNITHTRGDAVAVTVHPYQQARMTTTLRDIRIWDTNGTAMSIVYTSDKAQPLWGELRADNITLIDQLGGLVIQEHKGTMTNLTIRNSRDFDLHKSDLRVPQAETGILELHSAAMDRTKVTVTGLGSLWVFNQLRVVVEWQNGRAALDAGIQVQDRFFQVVAVGRVTSEAGMEPVELLAYIMDAEEFRSRSPFVVNITFLDLEQTGVCSLDEPALVRIVVHDRVAPSVVVLEPDDGASQRASYFELRGSAFDAHSGILDISYRIDGGEWASIGSASPFRTTVAEVEPGAHVLELDVVDRAGNVAKEVVHVEIDNQPPRLVIASPEGDLLTRKSVLTVRGETEDGAQVSINGENVTTLHGLFIAEVQLEEGPNTVTVVSMDRLSNVATIRFLAVLDTVEPFLDVHSHEDGDWVPASSDVITGVAEEGCNVTVDGVEVQVVNGSFEAPIALRAGDNVFVIRAVDPAGNVYSESLRLYLASEPPWINLEAPAEMQVYDRHEVRVLGTVQDGAVVTVNGRRVTIQQGLVDELLILPEGASLVILEATDRAGNLARVTRSVVVDTIAPVLTLDPTPASTREPTLNLSGLAEGATSLWLEGARVAMDENGSFWVDIDLVEGTNVLRFLALDGAGHEDRATATVALDTTPPFLSVLLPPMEDDGNGTYLSSEMVIRVRVVSEPGTSVTLNGLYVIVGDGGSATVDMLLDPDSDTTLSVVAEDEMGNSVSQVYSIAYSPASEEASSMDLGTALPLAVNIVLLAVLILVLVKYRALLRRPPRRRPRNGHRNGSRPNGRGPSGAIQPPAGGGELP